MGGGLMQLVAYGAQDIYLTGNPQITFFKVVYRRHTNFSMETIKQTLNGGDTVSDGRNAVCTVSRNGDLVHKVYVNWTSTAVAASQNNVLAEAEIEIGGQMIDRQKQLWNQVWNELSTSESKAAGLKCMQGEVGTAGGTGASGVTKCQIPLNFWFCRNPGLALPLIALQYHEVKIKLKWAGSVANSTAEVVCDYIYLDTDERRRFAQVSHEYLIEQVQHENMSVTGLQGTVSNKTHSINFNHPVKELIWTTDQHVKMENTKLVLNGHDRFSEQTSEYFRLRQPFDYHTAVPLVNLPDAGKVGRLPLPLNFGNTQVVVTGNTDVITVSNGGTTFTIPANANSVNFSGLGDTAAELEGKTIMILVVLAAGGGGGITSARGDTFFGTVSQYTPGSGTVASEIVFTSVPVSRAGAFLAQNSTASGALQTTETLSFSVVDETRLNEARTSKLTQNINVYSFALKPEEHQPSGTCNFSRIDNAQLVMNLGTTDATSTTATVDVFAVNYNVLRIMSGMGGLAYSN